MFLTLDTTGSEMQDQDGTVSVLMQNQISSVLILLASCQHNLDDVYHCCVYSEKTPDDGQRDCNLFFLGNSPASEF